MSIFDISDEDIARLKAEQEALPPLQGTRFLRYDAMLECSACNKQFAWMHNDNPKFCPLCGEENVR